MIATIEECQGMNRDELAEKVHQLDWVHQIDLGQGLITPGRWEPHPLIIKAFDTIDFSGKKVLDIGCWDGLWSFEAERRGAAEVYATDFISQRSYNEQPTFMLAHRALGSRVKYFPKTSVFDIESLGVNNFDVVIFCGVYYHLRCPLTALAKLRSVMNEGARIVIEGDAIFGTERVYADFFYSSWHLDDPSNWWVPSIRCLEEWVQSSFFQVQHSIKFDRTVSRVQAIKDVAKRLLGRECTYVSRAVVVADAARRQDPNYIFPDDLLAPFDSNAYAVR